MTIVFVYGSLLSGLSNHRRLLARSKPLGEAITVRPLILISMGSFPACVAPWDAESTKLSRHILGELYEVDQETLQALHDLEGHPTFYEFTAIYVCPIDQILAPTRVNFVAGAYLLPPDNLSHRMLDPNDVLTHGSWRRHLAEEAFLEQRESDRQLGLTRPKPPKPPPPPRRPPR